MYTAKFAKEPFIQFVWGLEKRLVTLFCCSVHEHEFERGVEIPQSGNLNGENDDHRILGGVGYSSLRETNLAEARTQIITR